MADLYEYCEKGDLENVKKIVNQSNVNYRNYDNFGFTPLLIATRKGQVEIVKVLLSSGANINVADNYKRTPLYIASCFDHIDIVKTLVSSGANIKLGCDLWTPLYIATYYGHTEILKILVLASDEIEINYENMFFNSFNGEEIKRILKNTKEVSYSEPRKNFKYVSEDKIIESLKCSQCSEAFQNPKLHNDCQNIFCQDCIMKFPQCPLCNEAVEESKLSPIPKITTRKLDDLEVYCPDCNQVQKRGDLKSHLEKCSFVCPTGCKKNESN